MKELSVTVGLRLTGKDGVFAMASETEAGETGLYHAVSKSSLLKRWELLKRMCLSL